MSKLRRQLSAGITNNVETKSLDDIKKKTGNLYESIAIVGKKSKPDQYFFKGRACIINWRNLQAIPIAWKRFMKIKSRSKFPGLMKECLTRLCWLHRNSWRTKFISAKEKISCLIN